MALFTSYLSFLKTLEKWPNPVEFVYVARNRGNNEVAPPESILKLWKEGTITWEGYRKAYLGSLDFEESIAWMRRTAEKAKDHDVILICFEKDAEHCHRSLLAEEIARRFNVEFKGEVSTWLESALGRENTVKELSVSRGCSPPLSRGAETLL